MGMVENSRREYRSSFDGRNRKLWKMLRMIMFMIPKGILMKKSDLLMMIKRGKMNLRSLVHSSDKANRVKGSMDVQRFYEFSCSNSPTWTPLKRKHSINNYFTKCIHPCDNVVDDPITPYALCQDFVVPESEIDASSNIMDAYELGNGEDLVICTPTSVDMEAEDFISNFHKQMKFQRQVSWLQYEEMLDRGSS